METAEPTPAAKTAKSAIAVPARPTARQSEPAPKPQWLTTTTPPAPTTESIWSTPRQQCANAAFPKLNQPQTLTHYGKPRNLYYLTYYRKIH